MVGHKLQETCPWLICLDGFVLGGAAHEEGLVPREPRKTVERSPAAVAQGALRAAQSRVAVIYAPGAFGC